MGWKPGKLLKKVGKGLKKAVKSIGKGIKKVVGKIGAAIGKLGIIGQIGMMFLMPYAMSGLSSFFGGVGGKIATWSANLAGSNPVVSKFLGAVHKAGSMAVNAYNTVTTAIGNGVDRVGNFFKGEGFTLSGDRTSVFGGVSAKDIQIPEVGDTSNLFKGNTLELKESTLGDRLTTAVETGGAPQSLSEIAAQTTSSTTTSLLAPVPDVSDIAEATLDFGVGDKVADKTVGEYIKGLPGELYQGAKDAFADPGKLAQDAVESGIQSGVGSGIANRVASSIMGDPPVQRQHLTTQNLSQELYNDPTGMYNTINVALTQQGSPWGAGNLAHFNYMQEGLSDGSDEYARLMQRIS